MASLISSINFAPGRSIGSAPFQPSTTNAVLCVYSFEVAGANSTVAQDGYVEVLSDPNTTPTSPWGRVGFDLDDADAVNNILGKVRGTVTVMVPAGSWVKITSTTTSGTLTFTFLSQVEVVLNDIQNPITAGNGLALTGSTLDVNVDGSTIEINSDILRVKAAGITANELATDSVTGIKIAAAVAGAGLTKDGSNNLQVNTDASTLEVVSDQVRIKDLGVTGAKLATAVAGAGLTQDGSGNLQVNTDGSTLEVATDTVRIKDLGVTGAKLAAAVAGAGLTQDGSGNLQVNTDGSTLEVATDTVRVKDLGITTAKLADTAVTAAKIASSALDGQSIIGGAGVPLTVLDHKGSVRVATAASLPAHTRSGNVLTASANGAIPAQDGVTLALNDRILVKNEGAGTHLENGPYSVTQVGDGSNPWILTRTVDADSTAKVTSGFTVVVTEGTTNARTGWMLSTADPITLNTTALSFQQIMGAALGLVLRSRSLFFPALRADANFDPTNFVFVRIYEHDTLTDFGSLAVYSLDTTNSKVQIFENGVQVGSDVAFSALTSVSSGVYKTAYTPTSGVQTSVKLILVATLIGAPSSATVTKLYDLTAETGEVAALP